jgi:hypothetical protein
MSKKKTKRERTFCPYERKMVLFTRRGFLMICSSCKERID